MTGTIIKPADREAWLEERKKSIGGSDSAGALGVSFHVTPIDLWQRKLGIARHEIEENEAMWWGTNLEELIARRYEINTGRRVVETQVFCRHPTIPYMTATLDGIADDGRLVEMKATARLGDRWGEEGSDQVPDEYLVQAMHQLAVTGREIVDIPVFAELRLKTYTVPRNEVLIRQIEDGLARFWECVQTRTPPTWGRMTRENLLAIHPDCEGEIRLDDRTADAVRRYEELMDVAKNYEAIAASLKLEILQAMGNHEFAILPDGRKLKRYVRECAERTYTSTAKAHTQHYFRILKGNP